MESCSGESLSTPSRLLGGDRSCAGGGRSRGLSGRLSGEGLRRGTIRGARRPIPCRRHVKGHSAEHIRGSWFGEVVGDETSLLGEAGGVPSPMWLEASSGFGLMLGLAPSGSSGSESVSPDVSRHEDILISRRMKSFRDDTMVPRRWEVRFRSPSRHVE